MNLLIVDDEIVTTEVLREQIDRERLGIDEIYIAYNVQMGKEILERKQIDIVLCDIEMPKENGLKLLEWTRKQQKEIEFLFLTSHEKFEYAFGAVRNGASDYLLKPVDMPIINKALFVAVEKMQKKRQMSKAEEYWSYGKRRVTSGFWRSVVLGEFGDKEEEIEKEITRLGLDFSSQELYILIVLHMRKEAILPKGEDARLNQFILDNILAETLTKGLKMENIVHWEDGGEYYICAVSDIHQEQIKENVQKLGTLLNQFYSQPVYAGYLSQRGGIAKLEGFLKEILSYDKKNMSDDGKIQFFSEITVKEKKLEKNLESKFILTCLEKGERVQLLEYLQKTVAAVKKRDNSLKNMQYFQMDLIQIVSVFLHDRGMDLEILFEDSDYTEIQKRALTSEFAMIRWNTYLINRVFDSILTKKKSESMIDVVIDYIREHYEENITRTTLAQVVNFSPEYLGKVFKKQMGVSINDYINKYRIEKAKKLLSSTNYKVIDIALMVGFENMPYFSSVFKKYEGITPGEYKKLY